MALTDQERDNLTRQVRDAAAVRPEPPADAPDDRAMSVVKLVDGRTAIDSIPVFHHRIGVLIGAQDSYLRALAAFRKANADGVVDIAKVRFAASKLSKRGRMVSQAGVDLIDTATTDDARDVYETIAVAIVTVPAA